MSGGKGDVDISGGGGAEPRDDYATMNTILSDDFPVFEDGAGEVEEIPGGLPNDGTLYYFQSSYDFDTFPGSDGFFGFSNDVTYLFDGRRDTYGEVVAPGDWFVDFTTDRIYSFLDNLADSYMHICERQIEITYEGAPRMTLGAAPIWQELELGEQTTANYGLNYFFNQGDSDIIVCRTSGATAGFVSPNSTLMCNYAISYDQGRTWAPAWTTPGVAPMLPAMREIGVAGFKTAYSFANQKGFSANNYKFPWKTTNGGVTWEKGCLSDDYHDHYNAKFGIAWSYYTNSWLNSFFNSVFLRSFWAGTPIAPYYYIDGGSYPNDPAGTIVTTDIWSFEGFPPQAEWSPTQPYVIGNQVKGTYGTSAPGGVWQCNTDHIGSAPPSPVWDRIPGESAFLFLSLGETYVGTESSRHKLYHRMAGGQFEGGGRICTFISTQGAMTNILNFRHQVYRDGSVTWDYSTDVPDNISEPYQRGRDLGFSHLDMIDQIIFCKPLSQIQMIMAVHYSYYDNTRNYGQDFMHWIEVFQNDSAGAPGGWYHKSTIDLTGFDANSGPRQWGGIDEDWTEWARQTTIDGANLIPMGGGRYIFAIYSDDRYHLYTDDGGVTWDFIYTNVATSDSFWGGRLGFYGSNMTAAEWEDSVSPVGPPPPFIYPDFGNQGWQDGIQLYNLGYIPTDADQPMRVMLNGIAFSPHDDDTFGAEFEIVGREETSAVIVASEAGFTIRAQHINELRQKFLELNSRVQTGGTNRVNFGIDVSDLPTVSADKTAIRANHYSICKRETDKVIGQVGTVAGSAYYSNIDLTEFSLLMLDPVVDDPISIRTLIGMRKTLQALYSDGWFCACYSYCPCQTHVDIDITGGKK